MKFYAYEPTTLEFVGTILGSYDPVASEREKRPIFRAPANSTDIEPLQPKKGFVVCFMGDKWQYFEDHRGETVYRKSDLTPITIKNAGPISNLYLREKPKPNNKYQQWMGNGFTYNDIESIKFKIIRDLETSYDTKLDKYYKVDDYSVNTKWLQTYTTILNLMQIDIADGILDDKYQITLLDKNGKLCVKDVTSIEEFKKYYKVIKENYKKQTELYQQLLVKIENAETCEEMVHILESYDPEIIKVKEYN